MEGNAQEFSTDVQASVAQCFAIITDFERYPDWFSTVNRTKVLSRHTSRLAKRVEFHVDMKIKTVRYVLEYEYDKPTRLTWKAVEGDIEAIEGSYDLEKRKPNLTQVTCRQAVALGFWVPGPIRSLIERQALRQSVLEFKAAAEAAAREKKRKGVDSP